MRLSRSEARLAVRGLREINGPNHNAEDVNIAREIMRALAPVVEALEIVPDDIVEDFAVPMGEIPGGASFKISDAIDAERERSPEGYVVVRSNWLERIANHLDSKDGRNATLAEQVRDAIKRSGAVPDLATVVPVPFGYLKTLHAEAKPGNVHIDRWIALLDQRNRLGA